MQNCYVDFPPQVMSNTHGNNHHLIDPTTGHPMLPGHQFLGSNNTANIVDEAAMIFGAESGDYSFLGDYSSSPTMTPTPATNSSSQTSAFTPTITPPTTYSFTQTQKVLFQISRTESMVSAMKYNIKFHPVF